MNDQNDQLTDSSSLKLLVVEDESIVALYLKKKLQALGYQPMAVVTNGKDALAEIGKECPDLVLMDINLEGDMDGIETAEEVKKRCNIPIVYITAYSDEETLQRAKRTEPYGYLIKPFESGDIKVTVEIALYKHRLDQELKKREQRYRLLAENTRDIVGLLSNDGYFKYISPSVERISGYKTSDIIGSHFYDHLSQKDRARVEDKPLAELVAELGGDPLVTQQVTKNGELDWVESLLEPIYNGNGELTGFQSSERIINERVHAQEKLAQANEKLEQRNRDLRDLTARLQNIQEEERKTLSREIHDGLGQEMIGLKMQLSWIKNLYGAQHEEANQALAEAVDNVQNMIENVRNLAKMLRPALLDKMGLHEAIKYEVQTLRQHADFDIQLEVDEAFPSLSNNIAVAAFRIYQEAMTNVVKHADPSIVKVELSVDNEHLNLVVEDDGNGLNLDHRHEAHSDSGSGVLGMRERAEDLKGKFSINSTEKGTVVSVQLPLSH
ncbi:MAG: response regulator [Bacteroidota bacterium]